MGITQELADFSASVAAASLPTAVVERSRRQGLDLIGYAVRARHNCESTPALLAASMHRDWHAATGRHSKAGAVTPERARLCSMARSPILLTSTAARCARARTGFERLGSIRNLYGRGSWLEAQAAF
jgi:hypothetical protein